TGAGPCPRPESTSASPRTPSSSHVVHNEKRRFEIRDNRSILLRQISAIALDPLTRGRKILARRPTDNRRKTAVRIPVMLQLVYSGPYVSKVKRLRFMPQVVNIIRVDRRRPIVISGKDMKSSRLETERHPTAARE